MQTLHMLCRERAWSLDAMRNFVRKRPELRALGTAIGPSTAYTPDEVKKICEAWENRLSAERSRTVKV